MLQFLGDLDKNSFHGDVKVKEAYGDYEGDRRRGRKQFTICSFTVKKIVSQ